MCKLYHVNITVIISINHLMNLCDSFYHFYYVYTSTWYNNKQTVFLTLSVHCFHNVHRLLLVIKYY